MDLSHEEYMRLALDLAEEAAARGEVPVGCVVVGPAGDVLGRGRNRREEDRSAAAHAEMEAIGEACRRRGDWRLGDCTLYVTLEPCPMCAGAILNARVGRVVFGARDAVMGSCGSVIDLFMENYGYRPQVIGGVLGEECGNLLRDFFRQVRN